MKRFFSILLITALLLGLTTMVSSVALAEEYATVISDNGYGVRLREGPSKAYNVIAKYDVGTTVVVQQKGLEWSQLRVGDTVGWMMNAYLSFGTIGNVGEGGDVAGIGSATVISDNGLRVWLRTRPSGTRIRLYSPGTTVTVLEKGDPWSHISINGSIGYMMSRYLDFGSASAPVSRRVTAVSVNYAAPVAGDVLEAIVTPADATVAYSWKVDGVEQGTAATFNALTRYAGKKIQLTVTGIGACTGSATYTTEPVAATKRVDSVRLNKDEPYVGDTLSAITQPTSATVSYSWRVGGIEIGNEATYTVQESDLGKLIQLKVTGIDGFSGSAACSASAPVLSNKLVNSVKLTNTQPVPGDVLSFTVQPVGMTMDCVWKADGEVVGTTASYMVGQTDVGKVITLTVSGNGEFGGSVTVSTSKVTTARLVSVKIGNTAPLAGDWIYAVLEPKAATASYTWYADDEEIAVNRSTPDFVVPESAIGKKLTVKAIGTGAYTGTVNSAATGEVISSKQVTAVTLKNTTPVVGDTIGVKLTPAVLDDVQDQFSYVWTVGTTIKSNTSPVYTVEEEDVGKTIRVRVVGANGYTGDVYSAYTNPVIGESRLTGVTIWNNATDANATQHAPEVGDTLRALVGPAQAQDKGDVHYVWRTNNEGVVLEGDGAAYETYTVLERDRGMQISVTVSGIGKYVGDGKTTYTAAAARVATLEPLTVALNVPAPEAGKKPVYSVTGPTAADGRTILWRASLEWLDTEYNSGKLDEFGNFLPNYTYMVRATIAPANGYTMNPNVGATATVNGSTAEIFGNAVYYTFGATGEQQVNDYHITCISRPIPGTAPATYFEDTQYNGEFIVTESGVDENGVVEFTYDIILTAKDGYTFAGVPRNVFTVSGADAVSSAAGDGDHLAVTATYKVQRSVKVTADNTQINIDGINRRIVSCSAELVNFSSPVTSIQWSVAGATTDATSILKDTGKLVIGPNEEVDKDLIVTATVVADGHTYQGSLNIHLISGTNESNEISVIFDKAPVNAKYGETVEFKATAVNSLAGVTWSVYAGNNGTSSITQDGVLTIPADEKAEQVVVTATSIEDPSKSAKIILDLVPTVTLDNTAVVVNLSDSYSFTATASSGATVTWALSGNTSVETTLTADGNTAVLHVAETEGADQLTITATHPKQSVRATAKVTINKINPLDLELDDLLGFEDIMPVDGQLDGVMMDEIVDAQPVEDFIVVDEPAAEPAVEIVEEATEAPAGEPEEPTFTIIDPEGEEASAEQPAEAPAAELEVDGPDFTIEDDADDLVVIDAPSVSAEPVVEEPKEELTDSITITNEDGTVDAEISFEEAESKKPAKKEDAAAKAPESADKAEKTEEELDEEQDDPDSDENLGESAENASGIRISFVESAGKLRRGKSAQFTVTVDGSEEGVIWRVYHSGKDADGARYSSIKADGLSATLHVGEGETASRLTVVAISKADKTVVARWRVRVSNAIGTKYENATEEEDDLIVDDIPEIDASEDVTVPEPVEPDMSEEDREILEKEMEEDALQEENNDVVNFF